MSIRFEDAVATLQSMFPNYEKETLTLLLTSNNMNVERTIESVLVMDGALESIGSDSLPPAPQQQQQPQIPTTQPAAYNDLPPSSRAFSRPQPFNSSSSSSVRDSGPNGRNRRVELSDDFLRPPGWRENNVTLGDAQLAMMLQNELFQREAQAVLGQDYAFSGGPGSLANPRVAAGAAGNRNSINSQGPAEGIPDMGILKGLSNLSEQARRSLNQLAVRFQANNNSAASRSQRESEGLLGHADEQDEEEVINFQSQNHSHIQPSSTSLSRGGPRHTLDELSSGLASPVGRARLSTSADIKKDN